MWELATELYGSDWVNTTKEQLAFWRMRVVINKKNIFFIISLQRYVFI